MTACEYLLRVKPLEDGQGYSASIRQLAGTAHPEVRAVVGVVSYGQGANESAAMVAAVASRHLGHVVEVPRNGH